MRQKFGTNASSGKETNTIWKSLKDTVAEPMFVLLAAATIIYFATGDFADGGFMLAAIILVSAISFYQDSRSRKALQALKDFTRTKTKVLRNNAVIELPMEDVVQGDFVVAEEGSLIVADGEIVQAHDFGVNESILTGESLSVIKNEAEPENKKVFQGTLAVSGLAVFTVTAVGKAASICQNTVAPSQCFDVAMK